MNDEISELLRDFDEPIRQIAWRARAVITEALPGTLEQVDRPAKLLGYGRDRTYRGLICAIAPQRRYVNLMFSRGVEIPDPEQILEGTGKRARHVRLASLADVDRPSVRALLQEAGRLTP
jgi:hypothetical protein